MKRVFHFASHLVVIAALVFSSVGITTISLSCPMGKQIETGCPKCKHTTVSRAKRDACCKTTIIRSVLKTEFEKLDEAGYRISHHLPVQFQLPAPLFVQLLGTTFTAFSFGPQATTRLISVDKCVLFSSFLI